LDILQGLTANAAVIANHNVPAATLQSVVFVDYPVGLGAFAELSAPPLFGSDEPIFPETAGAADGSIILVGSRITGLTTYRNRTSDLASWGSWNPIISVFVSDGYVAEANATGRVGIAISAPSSPLWWLESTDNGLTWPSSPTQLLPEAIPVGPDTFVVTPGIDLVYVGAEPKMAFGVTKLINGIPSHRFSGIGFYSARTGFRLAVPHHLVPRAVDTLAKRQVNMYPVGYPSIGVSGSNIAIAFQAFMPETSQAGFNYADVFYVQSLDSGRTWSVPSNLTLTNTLDERYVSVSRWNHPGVVNLVYQEDPQPGAASFGPDASPLARTRQVYCRIGTPVSVDEVEAVPGRFELQQNYPNPFNPRTTIGFRVQGSGHVSLRVFDVLGREVATLVNEPKAAGTYTIAFDGSSLPSGVYFYRLTAGNVTQTRKMILLQ